MNAGAGEDVPFDGQQVGFAESGYPGKLPILLEPAPGLEPGTY
jgi:hypothetical protein